MPIPGLDSIALAFLAASSVYSADQGRKARIDAEKAQRAALKQQTIDAEEMRAEVAKQTAEYSKQSASLQEQSNIARQTFDTAQLQYAQNKAAMDKKAKEVQALADEERRKAAASEASALKARTRGGRRSLLSQERLTPELGVEPVSLSSGMRLQ